MEYAKARLALTLVGVVAALLLGACAHRPVPAESPAAPDASPYAGLVVGEGGEADALVVDVVAGPAALAGVLPGDRLATVDGEAVGGARFLEILRASRPGRKLALGVVREGRPLKMDLVVGDLERWASPARYPARVAPVPVAPRQAREWWDDVEARVDAAAPALATEKARIDRMLHDVAADPAGYNRLPLNRQALADPGVLVALDRRLAAQLDPTASLDVPHAPDVLVPILCEVLALPCPASTSGGDGSLAAFAAAIADANARVRSAFPAKRERMSADVRVLLQTVATRRTLLDRPAAFDGIQAMRYSLRADEAKLLQAFDLVLRNAVQAPRSSSRPAPRIPAALAAMVDGEIVDFAQVEGGYVVIGGPGANTYRMDKLYAVIDLGGDDRYLWRDSLPLETQTVIDLSGDDRYEAVVGGPGAGWLGVAVLIDFAGNDRYAAALGGCGAGVYGFGLLFDAGGDDTYDCNAWSLGAGIYGGGMLVDTGNGADTYVSHSLSQGVGGPAGAGLLVDGGGDDLYRANGPVPSTYDTPAVYMSFSQGVGFGIRPYDQGGFGALFDFGGNDRYEGGEFSQGGGYFHGVGLLHEAAGNDLYYGNRYAQGFACHQAAGLLTDLSGRDVYWAMAAAAQGAAWDQSVALLYDGEGDDFYRAESLAQGAAAEQSRAWLFDAAGNDEYSATESSQGAAADNSYHFRDEDPVVSLGVLVDGGGEDRYSSGLAKGETRTRHQPGNPGKGDGNAGMAIDLSP